MTSSTQLFRNALVACPLPPSPWNLQPTALLRSSQSWYFISSSNLGLNIFGLNGWGLPTRLHQGCPPSGQYHDLSWWRSPRDDQERPWSVNKRLSHWPKIYGENTNTSTPEGNWWDWAGESQHFCFSSHPSVSWSHWEDFKHCHC